MTPFPDFFQKGAATHLMTITTFLHNLAFHQHLCGNPGVVGTGLPKRFFAAHPVNPDKNIHEGILKRMPHMQGAGNIGWRQHDAVGVLPGLRLEYSKLLPALVTGMFYFGGGEGAI
jgi:hypothetical protein